ncbi:MAG: PSD1 and planctomycete cytochrome C domain-containing protein [Pirellulales bacterium]
MKLGRLRDCWILLGCLPAICVAIEPERVSFREQIRPILAANCFQCHGPDESSREADLRLDSLEMATGDRGGYAALVPGELDASELYRRVTSEDESEKMPPPESNKHLSAEQIELLKQWIEQGAAYEQHWSFAPPKRPPLPAVSDPSWPKNDIDRFVLAELDRHGLSASPPADRYQLVRRLYLDLIGLPPTPAEADEFVSDSRPDAYERLVDKLLASPHYGERWARRWLDLARYSDTNGYEKDRPRTMWPYRDWVIDAINRDVPFDQFTIEQLAGDMLPNATAQQRIATGFHRNTMVNEEGGIDPQEFRFNSVVDRVATTGGAWLGLTLGCAQCHTHKYDPLTHAEYYQVFSLLNNADEVEVQVLTPEVKKQREEIERQIGEQIAALPKQFADSVPQQDLDRAFDEWQRKASAELAHWNSLPPSRMTTNLANIAVLDDDSILVSGDVTKNDIYDLDFDAQGQVASIRIEALTHPSLPSGGPGRQSIEVGGASGEGDFFLSEMTAEVVEGDAEHERVVRKLEFASATATFVTPGMSAAAAFDGKSDTGWRVMGREGEPHNAVFRLREPVTLAPGQRLHFRLHHESFYPAGLGRFRFSFSPNEGELPAALYPDEIASAVAKASMERTAEETASLRDYFLLHTPELKAAQDKIAELRKQFPAPAVALVMQERTEHLRVTHRHHRGEFLKAEEAVSPGVPEVLPPLPEESPANRLTFARWLVDPQNPLVARVVVNRHWQALFGTGIVKTVDDFGLQGEFPSHPPLLDYLAKEFVRQGWSSKQLHKLIVMSATYQQSADVTPLHLERDPENRLLARAPRFRVEAELVRDIALSVSGLLSPQIGGPSVFPDQPPGITEAAYGPLAWTVSAGADRFRRGLYTFNKRTAPFASSGLFDAPSGEACVARRTYSSTPLQALAMLNDSTMQAAARELAISTLEQHEGNAREIATELFRRCVTRVPTDEELAAACEFQAQQQERLARGDYDAAAILHSGDENAELPTTLDHNSLAAWMLTARAILNLDETITRQ